MQNHQNISDIHDCYGCGVCSKPCPVHIIDLHLNSKGFYEPYLTYADKCIHCGLCRDVCAYIKDKPAQSNVQLASYAAWSKDYQVQRKCSSGGIGFEIARYLLSKGYKTVGVRYNAEKGRAEHFIASTVEELVQTIGSKYIQSYPVDGWKGIDRKGKYLITGTPCQIDSFKNYMIRMHLPEENFVLLDFFCHGVPSMFAWQKYCKDVEGKVGKITYASWRNKWTGWHDSWAMGIDGKKKGEKVDWHESYNLLIRGKKTFIQSQMSHGDKFYKLFLGDCALGEQCFFHCKYKYDHSSADIRIGDLWGTTYQNNEDGVSGVVAFTEKGKKIIESTNCVLTKQNFDIVTEGQMKACPPYKKWYADVIDNLADSSSSINDAIYIVNKNRNKDRWKRFLRNPFKTIYSKIRKHSSSTVVPVPKFKAAVITIYSVPNYGSVLQAFATQQIIHKFGWDCDIIRYKYPNDYHYSHNSSFKKKFYSRIAEMLGIGQEPRRRRMLSHFPKKHYSFTKEFGSLKDLRNADWSKYDVLISGSDQIWNANYTFGDTAFLLSFAPDNIKRISIAASCATSRLPEKYSESYRKELNKFSAISVREENSKIALTKQLGIKIPVEVILDPTLLLSSKEWLKCLSIPEKTDVEDSFILFYRLDYAFNAEKLIPYSYKVLKYISEKTHINKIIAISGYAPYEEAGVKMINASDTNVEQFVYLFSKASLVVTSSFHGTAFALNYGRPLIAITPSNAQNDDRQSSLLRSIGLKKCILPVNSDFTNVNPFYDENKEQMRLLSLRNESLSWINKALQH